MGWRSWNLFETQVSQDLIQKQIDGLTRVRHGKSLFDLGYKTIGIDDGWQDCRANGYHDETTGEPLINNKFPNMKAMNDYAHSKNVSMGWYGNNCGCHGSADVDRYEQDAAALVKFGFDGIKVDSCGPETNITAWRLALDAASSKYGSGKRIILENCRNYGFTQDLTEKSKCPFELFRSTEDNAPDFISIMHNLITNSQKPGSKGDKHGGQPVSHPSCWSYPDMLETIGSGKCRQDLKPGTCGVQSTERRAGGLDLNESKAHFGAWCVVSSPLTLGHDLSDDAQYDAAWPVVSNKEAIRVNQAWAGDTGRYVNSSTEILKDLTMYHGSGCDCPYPGTLPRWTVFAKRLALEDGDPSEVAVIAINNGNETLAANAISMSLGELFRSPHGGQLKASVGSAIFLEKNVWTKAKRRFTDNDKWNVPELAPRSSFFVTMTVAFIPLPESTSGVFAV